jgi:ABC-type uncharacterized transport system substrate-binding protein
MMRRREFITLLGGAAAGWPLAARAQHAAMPVIGFLSSESPELFVSALRTFRQGLAERGYGEGQNVSMEYRWAEGQNDRLPALAADLVRRRVNVIVVPASTPAALAAKAATATIPVVFSTAGDPVALGLVASLSRPGGNVTGVTTLGTELGPKRLGLLHELMPQATVIALLINPTNLALAESTARNLQAAANTLGLQHHVLHASTERDFDSIFSSIGQRATGLVLGIDSFFTARRERLGELALRHGVPAIYQTRDFAVAGGVMSYGGSLEEAYRLVGLYAGRILNGEKPTGLPVQQATRVELVINLRAAKVLGIEVRQRCSYAPTR